MVKSKNISFHQYPRALGGSGWIRLCAATHEAKKTKHAWRVRGSWRKAQAGLGPGKTDMVAASLPWHPFAFTPHTSRHQRPAAIQQHPWALLVRFPSRVPPSTSFPVTLVRCHHCQTLSPLGIRNKKDVTEELREAKARARRRVLIALSIKFSCKGAGVCAGGRERRQKLACIRLPVGFAG